MMVAFGIVEDASWRFYAVFPVFFASFVLIPGSLGAISCLLVAAFLPRRRKTILGLVTGIGAGVDRVACLPRLDDAGRADDLGLD